MEMPCGKYKGTEITELPSSYLLWIAENWDENSALNKRICEDADEEYSFREKHDKHWE